MNPEESEYQIQLFGFSVEEFIESNYEMIEENVQATTSDFIEAIIKKTTPDQRTCDKIREQINEVTENILKNSSSTIKEMAKAAKEHFTIPDNVLLIEDIKYSKNITEEEHKQLSLKLEELEHLFKENAFVMAALKDEIKDYEELQPLIEKETDITEKINETLKNSIDLNNESTVMASFDTIMSKIIEARDKPLLL